MLIKEKAKFYSFGTILINECMTKFIVSNLLNVLTRIFLGKIGLYISFVYVILYL